MEEVDLLPAPPYIVGPTWQTRRDGSFYLPEPNRTLGDQVVNWMYANLLSPGGEFAGEPFMPTNEQYRFLLWWYAIDEHGRFVYRNGVLRRMKGWGKDPLAAAMALADLCGPVVFSHWNALGIPVGKRRHAPWIQIAGVAQEQAGNTFKLFPAMVSKRLKEEFKLELNKTIIYAEGGGLIEALTSSPKTAEGNRPTFVVANEIQWWMENNDGHAMFNVIKGNLAKNPGGQGRWLAICNGHRPGEESIGERLWDEHLRIDGGKAVNVRMLYDSLEAPADTPIGEIPPQNVDEAGFNAGLKRLREGMLIARGDASWLDVDSIIETEVLSTSNLVTEMRRMYLNQINAMEDSWMSPVEWDRVADPELILEDRDRITLAFDGSKSNDWSALVACRVSDGALFVIKTWNPEHYDGRIPQDDVDATVHWVFSKYNVVGFRADLLGWENYIDQWSHKYGKKLKIKAFGVKPIAFDMRGEDTRAIRKIFALDCERFLDAVLQGELSHTGDKVLRTHVLNAHRHPTPYESISIRKATKDSPRKIDAAVCAVMAFGQRQEFLMSRRGRVVTPGSAGVFK